jgi:hypothetical protein
MEQIFKGVVQADGSIRLEGDVQLLPGAVVEITIPHKPIAISLEQAKRELAEIESQEVSPEQ